MRGKSVLLPEEISWTSAETGCQWLLEAILRGNKSLVRINYQETRERQRFDRRKEICLTSIVNLAEV